jgi:hypothetical protein
MGGYEETHWADAEKQIKHFRETLSAMPVEDRATKAMKRLRSSSFG